MQLTQIKIRTFCWQRSEPIKAIWNVQAGITNGSQRFYFMKPATGSHVPPAHKIWAARLTQPFPMLDITKADEAMFGMTNRINGGETFVDPAGTEWMRLKRGAFVGLSDVTYITRYVYQFDQWCENNPRAAWGLRRMTPGSKLRNYYAKQIIGTSKLPKIPGAQINADLWDHANHIEAALQDHNAEQAVIQEAINVDKLRQNVNQIQRRLRGAV